MKQLIALWLLENGRMSFDSEEDVFIIYPSEKIDEPTAQKIVDKISSELAAFLENSKNHH
jgi:hypothetical protein